MSNSSSFFQRNFIYLLIGGILVCIASQIYIFGFGGLNLFQPQDPLLSATPQLTQTLHTTHPNTPNTSVLGVFGFVVPRWDPATGYGSNDTTWFTGLTAIKAQTGARWIEMPISFQQSSNSATVISTLSAPTVENFAAGVREAKALGFKVFIKAIINPTVPGGWSGSIAFTSVMSEQAWFDAFWQAYKPFVEAAAQNGVDQVSIGTELSWLQSNAPASLWEQYISQVRSVFSGTLTYDTNWNDIGRTIPSWMQDKNLDLIGVSEYKPLVESPIRVDPDQVASLWKTVVLQPLDAFAQKLGKSIFLSEIGYRNSFDTLYKTWDPQPHNPADPQEQAAACDAALQNVVPDPLIVGIFFWGWKDTGAMDLVGQPAVQTIAKWYTSAKI